VAIEVCPIPAELTAVVITGTRLPIKTLAFSLLRARILGLASTLEFRWS